MKARDPNYLRTKNTIITSIDIRLDLDTAHGVFDLLSFERWPGKVRQRVRLVVTWRLYLRNVIWRNSLLC